MTENLEIPRAEEQLTAAEWILLSNAALDLLIRLVAIGQRLAGRDDEELKAELPRIRAKLAELGTQIAAT